MKTPLAVLLSALVSGQPGAAVLPQPVPVPPAALLPAPPPPAPPLEDGAAKRLIAVEPAGEAQVLPTPPPAAAPAPADEAPAPSPLPEDARKPRRGRLTGGRLQMRAGVTAELLKDEGARDGFRLMRVGDSEGPMLQYAAPPVEAVDPLVVDLDGDGLRTRGRRVAFDIDGDGKRDSLTDIDADDGLLVFDADGNGRAGEHGGELLGDAARLGDGKAPPDGFAALETLVALAAADGLLSQEVGLTNRLTKADLEALEDSWGLRARVGGLKGRDVRLTELGVVRLDLAGPVGARHEDFDGRGNALTEAAGAQAVLADGTRRAYGELWLRKKTGTLSPLAR